MVGAAKSSIAVLTTSKAEKALVKMEPLVGVRMVLAANCTPRITKELAAVVARVFVMELLYADPVADAPMPEALMKVAPDNARHPAAAVTVTDDAVFVAVVYHAFPIALAVNATPSFV